MQVGIVHEQMKFPLWLHGQTVVMFLVMSTFPQKPVGKIHTSSFRMLRSLIPFNFFYFSHVLLVILTQLKEYICCNLSPSLGYVLFASFFKQESR